MLAIRLTCPHCDKQLHLRKDPQAGRRILCSGCHRSFAAQPVPIPAAAAAPAAETGASAAPDWLLDPTGGPVREPAGTQVLAAPAPDWLLDHAGSATLPSSLTPAPVPAAAVQPAATPLPANAPARRFRFAGSCCWPWLSAAWYCSAASRSWRCTRHRSQSSRPRRNRSILSPMRRRPLRRLPPRLPRHLPFPSTKARRSPVNPHRSPPTGPPRTSGLARRPTAGLLPWTRRLAAPRRRRPNRWPSPFRSAPGCRANCRWR